MSVLLLGGESVRECMLGNGGKIDEGGHSGAALPSYFLQKNLFIRARKNVCANTSCMRGCVRLVHILASLSQVPRLFVKMEASVCCAMYEQVMETDFSLRDKQSQIPECVMVVRSSPKRLVGCAAQATGSDALFILTYSTTHWYLRLLANTQGKCFAYKRLIF